MQIKECMTEAVSFVDPNTQIPQVARKMRDEDIGALPVVENDRLVGMVTDRDVVVRIVAAGEDVRTSIAREAMSPKILYCFDDQTVEEVLENMGQNQVRRLPVVNRDKRLVGVVSLGDLSKAAKKKAKAGEALEEISQPTHH
jgi:CBS domain-containing protein